MRSGLYVPSVSGQPDQHNTCRWVCIGPTDVCHFASISAHRLPRISKTSFDEPRECGPVEAGGMLACSASLGTAQCTHLGHDRHSVCELCLAASVLAKDLCDALALHAAAAISPGLDKVDADSNPPRAVSSDLLPVETLKTACRSRATSAPVVKPVKPGLGKVNNYRPY